MESNDYPKMLSINPEPLKLTTINDDCKEHIFNLLDLMDLVNIAETNKQLSSAVCAVFKRKYGNKGIVFGNYRERRYIYLFRRINEL